MQLESFLALPSWSVEYNGDVFDDARCADDGVWNYGDLVTSKIHPFTHNDRVVKICKNPVAPSTNT
jgi:hypothetical protein